MEAIQTFFANGFIIVALILGVQFAYQIVKGFGGRTTKDTLLLWGNFLLCVVAIAGIYDWISAGKSVSPGIAEVIVKAVDFGLESIKKALAS